MNRIDRLTAIMIKLQSKRRVSTEDISEHFNISQRTVFRDLRALGEAGVPIGHEIGKGYFIVDGYYLPPVLFTKEEAGSILMAGKFIEKQGDRSVANNFKSALLKIKSVLKSREKDFLEVLDEHLEVVKPSNLPKNPSVSDFFLNDIKTALVESKVLTFDYYSSYTDSTSSRSVEPMGLCHYGNHWHLIAYCQLREAVRDFRTDRISKLTQTQDIFDSKAHGDYRDFIGNVFIGTNVQEIKIQFTKTAARYLSDQKYYYGHVAESEKGDMIEMTFMAAEVEYFARWLVSFGNEFEVVSPHELKQHLKEIIIELQEHHLK